MSAKAKSSPISTRRRKLSRRLREAMAVQAIEENPLDAEQTAMFEMFERENWPHEKRRTFLTARLLPQKFESAD